MEELKYFNICINILAATDLPHSNISSLVCVEIQNERKCTKVVKNNAKPFYNEYFVFELHSTFSILMSTTITFKVFEPRRMIRRLVGCLTLEVATVWTQPDHHLGAWLAITLPSDTAAHVKGYLKCDIVIRTADDKVYPELSSWVTQDVLGGFRARYILRFYDCVGIEVKDASKLSDVTVKATFAGKTGSTTARFQAETVEWNEQITFIEFYPPLFQRITVDLYLGKTVLATRCFYLADISNGSSGGFMPTFGPTYSHFYADECTYCASIFMSIDAEYAPALKAHESIHGVTMLPINSIKKDTYGRTERFLCYGVLFDALIMDKSLIQQGITFNITLGLGRTCAAEESDSDEPESKPTTPSYKAVLGDSDFMSLPVDEHKPCVFIRFEWPNTHFRLTNSNIISNIVFKVRKGIDHAKELVTKREDEVRKILNDCHNELKIAYSIIHGQVLSGATSLDLERVKLLSSILNKLLIVNVKERNLGALLEKYDVLLSVLDAKCEDVQDSLPKVLIALKLGDEDIGHCIIHSREIFFSNTEMKKGVKCGKMNTLYLKNLNQDNVCKLDIWLWLGFEDQVSSCLQLLPPGHENISRTTALPTTLTYTTNQLYTGVCYVFGALIDIRTDSPELYNLSIRVLFSNQSRETSKIMKTLVPVWKETFTFDEVRLYPSPEYIKDNPPQFGLELWDHSTTLPTLIGSKLVIPQIRFQPISVEMKYELQWFELDSHSRILAVFEVIQLDQDFQKGNVFQKRRTSRLLPKFIEPPTIYYRIEVVFWGIRPVELKGLKSKKQLQAVLQWGSAEIKSSFSEKSNNSQNFNHNLHIIQLELPDIKLYAPPIVLRIMSSSNCIGFSVDKDVHHYVSKLPTTTQWEILNCHRKSAVDRAKGRRTVSVPAMPDLIPLMEVGAARWSYEIKTPIHRLRRNVVHLFLLCMRFRKFYKYLKNRFSTRLESMSYGDISVDEDCDWWYKYYLGKLIKYENELESQPEFCGFNDTLKTFTVKQQASGKLKNFATIKAVVALYQWPVEEPRVTQQGQDPEDGVLNELVLCDRVKVLVRVYCVKAHDLQPCDVNGKSDPYIEIATPSGVVSDKANYIPRQLNPVFGKHFEITATFPKDSFLVVRVMDWDRFTFNDVIGETVIDLENRFYSKFRATCGLQSEYVLVGHDKWRDVEKPTVILEKLCNNNNLPLPHYFRKTVLVGSKEFVLDHRTGDYEENDEKLALLALRRWNEIPIIGHMMVPEHVETRSLFHKDRPGIERGRLEMWVDMFDLSLGPVPAPLDITPREPEQYELRVVIWNTAKIPLVDDSYFVGRKHTDIYVKAWLGDTSSTQSTDVHYTSVNGEGNFNWRFIFPFQFIRGENKMVIFKREHLELSKTEYKMPPLLTLQVWDSDRISADDFIGSMSFDLNCMPRGARSIRRCKALTLTPVGSVDIFKVKRLRGWWQFVIHSDGKPPSSAGFLEAEIQLLTHGEALASPAGLGRSEPAALPPPTRPEFQIRFWLAPLRIISHYVFGLHKGTLILSLLIIATVIFLLVGIYSVPMFLIKKIIGA